VAPACVKLSSKLHHIRCSVGVHASDYSQMYLGTVLQDWTAPHHREFAVCKLELEAEFKFIFMSRRGQTASVVSDQGSWLQIQRSRVRFPALQDFLCGSRSGTGSTQLREDK
jgi:hypothetical protein